MKANQKLSEVEVQEIRRKFEKKLATVKALAFEYKVSDPHIRRIVKRQARGDVPEPIRTTE